MRKKHREHIQRKVRQVYNEIAPEFSSSRHYQWAEFDYFSPYISAGDHLLDLGCGNGRLYEWLKPKQISYIGVDQSEGMIQQARANFPEARFEEGDMADLHFTDQSFEVIMSIAAFHHLPGKKLRRQSVAEMHRLLKKDGRLILTVWNLFQKKYRKPLLRAIFSFLIHFGFKYAWNDLWIKWGKHPRRRYYHAFLSGELQSYFPEEKWRLEEIFYARKGKKVPFLKSFNICMMLKKK